MNYTNWSMSKEYNKAKLETDDEFMYNALLEARSKGILSGYLQNMINQYFFADIIQRELDKKNWIRRFIHRQETDYFPDGARLRSMMELLIET